MRTPSGKPSRKPRSPLDQDGLERLALHYVGRYATTRSRLRDYLNRKLGERGWSGEASASVDRVVERMAGLGYVDDAAFASARASAMQRRGYGSRRIVQALAAAGIDQDDRGEAGEIMADGALQAALRFAQRRRLGPYAIEKPDRVGREKAFAAMVRAGHPIELVRQIVNSEPGDFPE